MYISRVTISHRDQTGCSEEQARLSSSRSPCVLTLVRTIESTLDLLKCLSSPKFIKCKANFVQKHLNVWQTFRSYFNLFHSLQRSLHRARDRDRYRQWHSLALAERGMGMSNENDGNVCYRKTCQCYAEMINDLF